MLKHVDVKCLQSELCICVSVLYVCVLEFVCFSLGSESGEALWGGRGKNEHPQHTERAPIPLSSTLTVGLCSSQLPDAPPPHWASASGSAGLQRWAGEETRDPTFACSTEWRCFHLDLYHSYSSASPMNICLIHCFFFSIFPQEGAFALVFKSIHFPGEAVATRSARAMVSLNCNTLRFPHSFLALSIFWDELLHIIFLHASEQEPEGYNSLSPEKIYDVHLCI